MAIVGKHVEIVKSLIAGGVNVGGLGRRDFEGWTPLTLAVRDGYEEIIRLLIAAGADVNAGDKKYTPLTLAVKKRHKEIIKLLIVAGADVNKEDYRGHTPLAEALACVNAYSAFDDRSWWDGNEKGEYMEIVELLMASGAKS